MDSDNVVVFKQWSYDGQSQLCKLTVTASEYIHELIQTCEFCTSHHYTAKAQAQYLKKKIPVGVEAIVLLEFAENYSFLC